MMRGCFRICDPIKTLDHGVSLGGSAGKHQHQHHLHHRAYASLLAGKRRNTNTKISSFLNNQSPYSTYSTKTNQSKTTNGVLKWYLAMLQTRPFITKSVSSSLIFTAADVTSQMITMPPSGSYDSVRTLRIAGYGLLVVGPCQHIWFTNLSKAFPKTDALDTLKKLFMGQAVFGPVMNTLFFSYNAALQGETKEDIVARLKRDLLPTMKNNAIYWPMCDFLTFKFIPVHLQPLANSAFAYIWTIYLTYMANLKKVGED